MILKIATVVSVIQKLPICTSNNVNYITLGHGILWAPDKQAICLVRKLFHYVLVSDH